MTLTMPDRNKGPHISQISEIHFPAFDKITLANNIPMYVVKAGTQDVIKMEIIFYAGRSYESTPLVSRAVASLLKDGTTRLTSNEIATMLDYYGSTLHAGAGMDTSSITLYCLKKHFTSLLPTVVDLIQNPSFPQKDLDQFIDRSIHRLKIELQKNDVVAYRTLTECIFGKDHPYGYNSTEEMYRSISRSDLIDFHRRNYGSKNATVFLSGKVDDDILTHLDKAMANIAPGNRIETNINAPKSGLEVGRKHVDSPYGYQSAIRIGKHLFNRNHKDFEGFSFLSTILGGYFGSRLMKNIREEKGYTYNIDCSIDTMMYDGYFQVGTEVAHENVEPTIYEIYKEIEILKSKPIVDSELTMVKNYLIGNLLHLIDGPFNIAKMLRTLHLTHNDSSYLNNVVQNIISITPEQVQSLANLYFAKNTFHEVVVGARVEA